MSVFSPYGPSHRFSIFSLPRTSSPRELRMKSAFDIRSSTLTKLLCPAKLFIYVSQSIAAKPVHLFSRIFYPVGNCSYVPLSVTEFVQMCVSILCLDSDILYVAFNLLHVVQRGSLLRGVRNEWLFSKSTKAAFILSWVRRDWENIGRPCSVWAAAFDQSSSRYDHG